MSVWDELTADEQEYLLNHDPEIAYIMKHGQKPHDVDVATSGDDDIVL